MKSRSCFPLAILVGGIVPSIHVAQTSSTDNVLVIVADDLGVDKVSVYAEGTTPPPTPNLDSLARGGVLFRNAWANALCSPSRACIQTGRYALRTRVGQNIGGSLPLSHRETTIPEALDLGGSSHAHAAIGKWHLGSLVDPAHPNDAGWSHYAGLMHGSLFDYFVWPRTVNGRTGVSTTYATTAMVDDALAWIGMQTGPWVCYLGLVAPHLPIHAPPGHLHTQGLGGRDPLTDPIPFHTAMVEAMDSEIGRLLTQLGPELQSTNVIFISDNGTERGLSLAPFSPHRAKGSPYEGGLNVPLIVSGPAVQSPGREVDALVCAVDVFATVLELAGVNSATTVPAWNELDAISFVPYLADPAQSPLRTTAYAEQFAGVLWPALDSNGFAAIRDARYKLVRSFSPGAPPAEELYDLIADPFETSDLMTGALSASEHAALTALRNELDRLRRPGGALGTFGTAACRGSNGNPAISGSGVPTIGGSYNVMLNHGAINSPTMLFVSLSDTHWGPIRLPFELALLGSGQDCVLYAGADAQVPQVTTANGSVSLTIAAPRDIEWVGVPVFHTWLVLDVAAPNNPIGLTASDGLVALLGL